MMTTGIAMVLGAGGAVLLYMASPAQQLCTRRPAFRGCVVSGCVMLSISLLVLLATQGSGTAVFEFLTLLMSVWSLVPLAAAVWRKKVS
ncbi:MAG: hypothetical protein ABF558_02495 [Gluconobacter sp.]|uniref:hypothetical protein n=1 Tax=Gluconobacter sp. P5B12 TaxID=2762618 RepID=UPI0017549EBD|nr:hypothetical protein [Gluconobacter sp. P5B12]GFE95645.1 hypothetical protein DmGdi_07180 [Gluconobacter sp. Gdi]